MEISREEFEDLHGQVSAHKFLINALLIALLHKNLFTDEDVAIMVESTIASRDASDDVGDAVAEYLQDFRIASRQD